MQDIKQRGDMIGLALTELCTRAGVDQASPYRWLHGSAGRSDMVEVKLERLEAELRKAELKTFLHLKRLPHLQDR